MEQFAAVIYTLTSKNTELVYIGSTQQSLSRRLQQHRYNFKSWESDTGDYVSSFKILEYGDVSIDLYANVEVSDIQELRKIEADVISQHTNAVNIHTPGRTSEEYREDNRERLSEYHKQWFEENRARQKEQYADYYEQNKERIKARVSEYRKNNQAKVKACVRKSQQKPKVKAKRAEKITCECGSIVTRGAMGLHLKSMKHTGRPRQIKPSVKPAAKARRAEKITCSCGSVVTRGAMGKHLKSKKHLAKQF